MNDHHDTNREADIFKPIHASTCLVAVSDSFYMTTLRETLREMKFGNIEISRDGAQALFLLKKHVFVDLIIAQEDLPIYQCKDIVRLVRSEGFTQQSYLPIICIGWKWTHEKIEIYRRLKVDDIIAFPTSRYGLQRRVLSALYSDRRFDAKRSQKA